MTLKKAVYGVDIIGRDLDATFWAGTGGVRRYRKVAAVLATKAGVRGNVLTPEGMMEFGPDDYLVTDDPPTHAWPVRKEIFERTYVLDEAE